MKDEAGFGRHRRESIDHRCGLPARPPLDPRFQKRFHQHRCPRLPARSLSPGTEARVERGTGEFNRAVGIAEAAHLPRQVMSTSRWLFGMVAPRRREES